MRAVNEVRLVLGTRLDVTEEGDERPTERRRPPGHRLRRLRLPHLAAGDDRRGALPVGAAVDGARDAYHRPLCR